MNYLMTLVKVNDASQGQGLVKLRLTVVNVKSTSVKVDSVKMLDPPTTPFKTSKNFLLLYTLKILNCNK